MKLADLRRLAIRKDLKIHFRLRNGLECVVNRDGIAQVPGLKGVPDFNLDEELDAAIDFLLEPPPPGRPRKVAQAEMMALSAAAPAASAAPDHEDE